MSRTEHQKVQVILSTYNGAQYVDALMQSILDQDHPNLEMIVRDDGSTDGTVALLQGYATDPKVRVAYEGKIGVLGSYMTLLKRTSPDAGFIAFCDQDDFWDRSKVSRAVEQLAARVKQGPGLYCGRVKVVDENLTPLGLSPVPRNGPSFANALVENIAFGCTTVINAEARDHIMVTDSAIMHDWWAYLVVSAFGEVVFDRQPQISYRQHDHNTLGFQRGWKDCRRRFKRFRSGNPKTLKRQAESFKRLYGSKLSTDRKSIIDRFLEPRSSIGERVCYALSTEVHRQSIVNNLILKALIMLDRV